MKHEDGYCDRCGCEVSDVWLTFAGDELCRDCALGEFAGAVKVPRHPEARDDGK